MLNTTLGLNGNDKGPWSQLCVLSVTMEWTKDAKQPEQQAHPAVGVSLSASIVPVYTYPREPSHASSACWVRQSASHIPPGGT